jgi:hypothetical protein
MDADIHTRCEQLATSYATIRAEQAHELWLLRSAHATLRHVAHALARTCAEAGIDVEVGFDEPLGFDAAGCSWAAIVKQLPTRQVLQEALRVSPQQTMDADAFSRLLPQFADHISDPDLSAAIFAAVYESVRIGVADASLHDRQLRRSWRRLIASVETVRETSDVLPPEALQRLVERVRSALAS